MSSIDLISTQKDEVKAIKSIFGKEFKMHRPKNLKKKFESPCISIAITFSASTTGKPLSVQLWFDCSRNYPLIVPDLSLKEAESLSSEIQASLLQHLKNKSSTLLGKPMMHTLVESAREYLDNLFRSSPVIPAVLKNQSSVESENKQREMKLRMLRVRKDSAKESLGDQYLEKCKNVYHNGPTVLIFEHCGEKIPIEVHRGVCEGNHKVAVITGNGRMVTNCFEGFIMSKGLPMKINQISLQNLSKKSLENLKNVLLKKLEEDFYFLYKLSHCNILPCLGFRHQVIEESVGNEKIFELDIQYLTPHVGNMRLATQCSMELESTSCSASSQHLSLSKIRFYLRQVVEGVRYLHEKNVTNINLNLDTMLIDKDFNLKIVHYYIGKRFDELKISFHKDDEAFNVKKGSKKNDIFNMGQFAKQLFFFGLSNNEMNEEEIPCELMGFIDYTRYNTSDLHNHPFLCPQLPSKDTSEEHENQIIEDLSSWEQFDKVSRIPTEFEPIQKLGEGAFGDVVKVRNVYDNQCYAIKRVKMKSLRKTATKRTMKEVQLLSSLNHENIVRYYASWSEDIPVTNSNQSDGDQNSSTINNISLGRSIIKKNIKNSALFDIEELSDRVTSDFFNHNESRHFYDMISDSDDEFNGSEDDDISKSNDSISNVTSKGYVNDNSYQDPKVQSNKTYKFLMIQMELCEGPCNTLDKYINEEKLYLNDKLIWKFVREMVSGLEHIHSKNMIHRDLKPTNIFIDHQKKVKIGDLGLATSFVTKAADAIADDSNIVSSETGPVGTLMYICPEMICRKPYNNKADMYSLGIIVFEMCHPSFSTMSERYHVLGGLRQPEIKFPPDFKIKDHFKDFIESLLNHDPSKRPSASELLRSSIIPPPEARETELVQALKEVTKNRSSNMYKSLLGYLFKQTESREYDLPLLYQSPFKYYLSNTKPNVHQLAKRKSPLRIDEGDYTFFTTKRLITRYIESVFVCHGAVEFNAPLLSPKTTLKDTQSFALLDCEGTVVNLPANLRENFANFLINNQICTSRRFAIASVYHHQEYRSDHPKELLEAVFDIVSDYENCNGAAECIYILSEIFGKLFNREHVKLKVEINHMSIIHGIMEYYKIPNNIFQRILSSIHEKPGLDNYLDSEDFRKDTSLSDSQMLHIRSLLLYNGRIEDFEKFLKIFFNKSPENACCKRISDGFTELLTIVQMLDRFPDPLCFEVCVSPTYVPIQYIYGGFVFQMTFMTQDKFDFFKPSAETKMMLKYLQNIKRMCFGGDYSNYLKTPRQLVSEDGDVSSNVNAVGLTIDVSTLIQCFYSVEQLLLMVSVSEGKHENVMNSVVNVIIQYDVYFDKNCKDILSALWKIGISTVLFDKDDTAEDYVVENKIDFLIKILKKDDRRCLSDYKIVVKKNDSKVEDQLFSVDDRGMEKAIEYIAKELKKKDTFVSKLEKECVHFVQRPHSESSAVDSNQEIDYRKFSALKSEVMVGRYTYVFVNMKEGRHNKLEIKYLAETYKQIQSLRLKNPDFDLSNIQFIVNLNQRLINISKWFQGKLADQLYVIIVDMSYDKCIDFTSNISLRALKDQKELGKIISKIESSNNYSSNSEKHWKDVSTRLWKEIQDATKNKIYKILIYSDVDDNLIFLDIK